MSIYITGDCHGDFERFSTKNLKRAQLSLTENDIMIVAGDMGIIWGERDLSGIGPYLTRLSSNDLWWIHWLEEKPFQMLFIDGNHENFDLLNSFPIVEKYGAPVNQIGKNIFRLRRGQVYTIHEKRFFTMGGATSIDRALRRDHISWWPEEVPSMEEWETAFQTLDTYKWSVDYVVTHSAPNIFIQNRRDFISYEDSCPVRQMLNRILKDLQYTHWYFGHFHEVYEDPEYRCSWLYKNIEKIL